MINRRTLLAAATAVLSACGGSGAAEQSQLQAIAKEAGITFPESSSLLFADFSLLNKSAQWMVRAEERFSLPGEKVPVQSEGVRLEMDRHLKPEAVGDLSDPIATEQTWQSSGLRYRGSIIRSTNGYFLRLERFAQP